MRQTSSCGREVRRRRLGLLAGGLALCAASLLIYLPTPGDYWIRYDNEHLLRAPRIRALALEGSERVDAVLEMFTTPHSDLYQPLMTLSIALDYRLFGNDRSGYHAHALALHVACVLAVFALAVRLTGAAWASFLAVLLAAVHPTLVETTSWVVHRTILTATLWTAIGAHAYLTYARDPTRWPWLGVATLAFALGLLGKSVPSVALIPFAIDLWLSRRFSARVFAEKLPLAIAVLFVCGLNLHFSRAAVDPEVVAHPFIDVAARAPAALVLSAANLVWPTDLTIFYAVGQTGSLIGARWIAVALAALLVAAGGAALWRRGVRGPLLAAALWVAYVAPHLVAGTYRDTSTADRYAYTATLLLALGLAAALAHGSQPPRAQVRPPRRTRWGAGLAMLALALPLGVQARTLARRWSDEALLWQAVIERSPHPTALGALGNVYAERRDWPASLEAYRRALALLPNEPIASRRGIYHSNAIRFALAAYDEAVRGPGDRGAADPGRYLDLAVHAARDASARWPQHTEFSFELGRALLARKDYAGAAQALERVVALQPDHVHAWVRLGLARRGLGEAGEASAALREALRLQPRYLLALKLLANLYWEQASHAPAAETFLAWADAQPSEEAAHRGFSAAVTALEQAGADDEAAALRARYAQRFPDARQAPESGDAPSAAAQSDAGASSGSM
jgi:tetratricopeptide (TPR) repeat protein